MKLLLFLLIAPLQAFGQVAIKSENRFPISVHEQSQILDAGELVYSIDSILSMEEVLDFQGPLIENSNLGFTKNNFWLKFQLINSSKEDQLLYFETGRPITDVVVLYQVVNGKIESTQLSGDMIPFDQRPFAHRKLIFPVKIAQGEQKSFYINYHSDGEVINLPLYIHDPASLTQQTSFEQMVFGVFYGILSLAGCIYLFFYFGIKEKSFLLYSAYVLSIALLHSCLDGYFYQYITQEPSSFSDRSLLIFAALSTLALGRYTQVYMQVAKFSKKLNLIFNVLLSATILVLLGILLVDQFRFLFYPVANAIGLFLLITIIITLIRSYWTPYQVDAYFTAGIGFLTLGFTIFILNNFSLIENSFLTANASKIGTGLEIIFLSLSMANRISILKTEKEKMQSLALQRAEESNEIKSYFLSNMSHELRTPLNAILGLSNAVLEESNDPKIKENIEVIKYSSLNLLNSINDILDYSKIEKGELKLNEVEFEFSKVINKLKNRVTQQAKDKGLDLILEEMNLWNEKLIGDPLRIEQIIGNVLQNSLKFTSAGFVKLKVSSTQKSKNKVLFNIEISDSGIGIKKEKIERIFDSFSQERIDDKRKFGGFGLGLCIVKSLVNLHHGKISIQSEEQVGTTVMIQLELTMAKEPAKNGNDLVLKDSKALLQNKHFLVVEDNRVNQLVMKSMLKKFEGVSFDFADDGLEALQAMQEKQFDLILMDLQMPNMDGYEATIEIRNGNSGINSRDIPIIAVTADTTEKARSKVIEVGMDDYISKPIDVEKLRISIIKALFLDTVTLDL